MLVVSDRTQASQVGSLAAALISAGEAFYNQGWALGTSGNFSAVIERSPLQVLITPSGTAKGALRPEDFLVIDGALGILRGHGKPSAESELHAAIYRARPEAGAVLHTHSIWATLLSERFAENAGLEIRGFEMLKGLAGVSTHEHSEHVPVLENSQDYAAFGHQVHELLLSEPLVHGFLIRRHGLYTWGSHVAEARRHVEIFEFLFEVTGRLWERGG